MRTPRPINMKAEAAPSSADDHLDCAAHYGFAASVDAPHEEAYRARFNPAIDACLAAHPAAASWASMPARAVCSGVGIS